MYSLDDVHSKTVHGSARICTSGDVPGHCKDFFANLFLAYSM